MEQIVVCWSNRMGVKRRLCSQPQQRIRQSYQLRKFAGIECSELTQEGEGLAEGLLGKGFCWVLKIKVMMPNTTSTRARRVKYQVDWKIKHLPTDAMFTKSEGLMPKTMYKRKTDDSTTSGCFYHNCIHRSFVKQFHGYLMKHDASINSWTICVCAQN